MTGVKTGVVFLKIKKDNSTISIDDVTTLKVKNNGVTTVFVNDVEIASKEVFTLVDFDGTTSKIDLDIRFGSALDSQPSASWNKKELDIIYKKILKCRN